MLTIMLSLLKSDVIDFFTNSPGSSSVLIQRVDSFYSSPPEIVVPLIMIPENEEVHKIEDFKEKDYILKTFSVALINLLMV